jgi:hypothetical protein
MMLNLGHNHPDFTYDNDQAQAKLTLSLGGLVALLIVAMILMTVI